MTTPSTIIGIDLGGTKTAIGRFDAQSMERQNFDVSPTNAHRSFAAVRDDLLQRIEAMRTPDTRAIGIGVPGLVENGTRKIITMPNIPGAEGQDLAGFIEEKTGLPVVIENDARCFTYAEALNGAGKGHNVVVGVTMGTGVGGGVVIDGGILQGSHGFAGEIGHMLLVPGKVPFEGTVSGGAGFIPARKSSLRGEVEDYLSGTAMGRRCEAAKRPQDYLEGSVCEFMQPDVFREVAWMVTNLTYLVDPSIIVFGGSAGRALKPHLEKIETELRKWLLPTTPTPKLAIGTLQDAAVLGAAILASETV